MVIHWISVAMLGVRMVLGCVSNPGHSSTLIEGNKESFPNWAHCLSTVPTFRVYDFSQTDRTGAVSIFEGLDFSPPPLLILLPGNVHHARQQVTAQTSGYLTPTYRCGGSSWPSFEFCGELGVNQRMVCLSVSLSFCPLLCISNKHTF